MEEEECALLSPSDTILRPQFALLNHLRVLFSSVCTIFIQYHSLSFLRLYNVPRAQYSMFQPSMGPSQLYMTLISISPKRALFLSWVRSLF